MQDGTTSGSRSADGRAADADAPLVAISRPETGVAVAVLNRPATRNSLSIAMLNALHDAIGDLGGEAGIHAIVIAAEGPAFSAGHDLKELRVHRGDDDGGRAFFEQTMAACSRLMLAIMACPKPVIAAVEGIATAAGCQLVATCDLAVAAGRARFCTPGVNIGLFCSTPMVALSRNIPRKHAMSMLLSGDMIDAQTAAAWGLVNSVVPDGKALEKALELARGIAAKSPLTVATGKRAFYEQLDLPVGAAYEHASRVMVENLMARDAEEGIGAFLDKRAPEWKGC